MMLNETVRYLYPLFIVFTVIYLPAMVLMIKNMFSIAFTFAAVQALKVCPVRPRVLSSWGITLLEKLRAADES